MADWHEACLVSQYKDVRSEEYRRDLSQYGVYVIFELTPNGEVPLFVEALPRYVGMSTLLSERLRMHATGRSSNPAEHVMEEYMRYNFSETERARYNNAPASEQQRRREAVHGSS